MHLRNILIVHKDQRVSFIFMLWHQDALSYIIYFSFIIDIHLSFQGSVGLFYSKVNSVQEACAKCFTVQTLKFEILQITWKNETKNIRFLFFSFSPIGLAICCFVFMCFTRFQILISELQSILCKLLVLSWLYTKLHFPCGTDNQTKNKVFEYFFL